MQIEGPKSPEEMLTVLQRVLEESSPVLVSARLEAEERRTNIRLREEQDAAYQAALEADQVCVLFFHLPIPAHHSFFSIAFCWTFVLLNSDLIY